MAVESLSLEAIVWMGISLFPSASGLRTRKRTLRTGEVDATLIMQAGATTCNALTSVICLTLTSTSHGLDQTKKPAKTACFVLSVAS